MKKSILKIFSIALLLVITTRSDAIMIGFEPLSQTTVYQVGDSVDVELVISGLGSGAAPSLGAFDVLINFNNLVLDYEGVTFGDPILGDQLDPFGLGLESIGFAGTEVVGTAAFRLFEVSLEQSALLDVLQVDTFTLATLNFTAIKNGRSQLDIIDNPSFTVFSDAQGNVLPVEIQDGSIAVPEPSTLLILSLGLVGLLVGSRYKQS